MTPLPVLQGGPAMGIVPLYQLTMSPGGPCRPWGPMGPGSPWERQRDEGGARGAHPAQGSCAHAAPRSPPLLAGPRSLGGRVCRSHPRRRKGHGGQCSACRPWPRTEVPGHVTTQVSPSATITHLWSWETWVPCLPLEALGREKSWVGVPVPASRLRQVTSTPVSAGDPNFQHWAGGGQSWVRGHLVPGTEHHGGVTRKAVTHRRTHHPWWPGGARVTLGRKR